MALEGRAMNKNLSGSSTITHIVLAAGSLLALLLLGFSFAWWLVLVAIILLLVVGLSAIREVRAWRFYLRFLM